MDGCSVIGTIKIQKRVNLKFQQQVSLPMFIPESLLEKEKDHVGHRLP